jgi:hypothetical protein
MSSMGGELKVIRRKKPVKSKKPAHRPSLYNPTNHPLLAESMIRNGKTEEEVAKVIGIDTDTLRKWKKRYPDFEGAIKNGRLPADEVVESALYKRARGMTYDELEYRYVYNHEKKRYCETLAKRTKKTLAPDIGAICFWLKNRRGDVWKETRYQENTNFNRNNETLKIDLSSIPSNELKKLKTMSKSDLKKLLKVVPKEKKPTEKEEKVASGS